VLGSICLAGHPEPAVIRSDGTTELVGVAGDLLGVIPDDIAEFRDARLTLSAGESLVFYTDGITERRNNGDMFGQEGLRRALEQGPAGDAQSIVRRLEQAARTFTESPLRDDLAVLAVRHRT
jgi:serine phosphatase RsbU (regulator of sigma subunit)